MSPKRIFYIGVGFLAVALGVVGIFLPMVPTTPFLLVAAWAFSRGSQRFHDWLLNHPWFGPPVKNWRERGAIRLNAKMAASLLILASGIYVFGYKSVGMELGILIAVTFLAILTFIWTRPER